MALAIEALERAGTPLHISEIMKHMGPDAKRSSVQTTLDRACDKSGSMIKRSGPAKATYDLVR